MRNKDKTALGVRILLTLGKIALFILAFPYQVVINRKEDRYSVRSLLSYILVERKESENGKKNFQYTLSFPGISVKDLYRKLRKKKETPAEASDAASEELPQE